MRKFKKALAFALASAMIVSVVPVSAATSNSAKAGKSTIYYNGNADYKSTWVKVTKKSGYTVKFFNQNKKVADLNTKTGKVTAKTAGTAQVKVNFYKGGKYVGNKVVKISVKKAPVAYGIKVEKPELTVGETTKVTTSNGVKVNCYSADKSVVTVNKTTGEVTAVAPGSTKIAVRNAYTSKKVYVDVTVKAVDAPVAKQTGANTITITNGVEMDKDTVKVTKGSSTVKTTSVESTTDKKTITIKTDDKITDGTYTVTVGTKTLEVSGQAEKVSDIQILSDKAAVIPDDNNAAHYSKATVGYKVTNQFGENITENVTLQANGTGVVNTSVSNGKVTFENSNGFIPNRDVVSLVLMYTKTGISKQATLTVSDAATISTLTYEGVYNVDGKTLTENSDPEEFYILFKAADQYNNEITSRDDFELNKDVFITLVGTTNLTIGKTVKEITKDGQKYLGVQLAYGSAKDTTTGKEYIDMGQTQLTAIAAGSGKTVNATVEVAAGNTVDSLSFNIPGTIAIGDEVVLDYTALDRTGKAVTDYNALSRVKITTSAGKLSIRKTSGGKAEFVYTADGITVPENSSQLVTISILTPTNKASVVQLNVQNGATAKAIKGIDNDAEAITGVTNNDIEVKVGDLIFKDQYGRTIADSKVKAALGSDVVVVADVTNIPEAATTTGAGITITTNNTRVTTQDGKKLIYTTANDTTDKTSIFKLRSSNKNSGSVTFYLGKIENGKVQKVNETTGATVDVKIINPSDVTNVKASVKGKVYVPSAVSKTEFAQGFDITSGGVELKDYTVTSDNPSVLGVDGKKVYANAARKDLTFDSNGELKVNVTISTPYTAPQKVEVTLTNKMPSVSEVNFTDDVVNSKVPVKQGDVIKVSGSSIVVAHEDGSTTQIVKSIKDSYGVEHTVSTLAKATGDVATLLNPGNTDFSVLNTIATYNGTGYKVNTTGTVVLAITYGDGYKNLTIEATK